MPSRTKKRMTAREKSLMNRLERAQQSIVRLRRENASLRRQLSSCRACDGTDRPARTEASPPSVLFADRASAADRLSMRSFPRYALSLLNRSYLAYLWRRWLKLFRRLRLVRTVITVIGAVLASAVLLTLVLAVLPFALVGIIASVMVIFLTARHKNRELAAAFCGKRVVVLAAPAGVRWEADPLVLRMARDIAGTPGCVAVILSARHLLSDGPGSKRPYFTARTVSPGLYTVRPLYWFSLRRCVLERGGVQSVVIY